MPAGSSSNAYRPSRSVVVVARTAYQPGQDVTPLQLVLMAVSPSGTVTVSGEGNADPDVSSDTREF